MQVRSGALRRGRWIVQFVSQTRRHGAEGNEFFPLLRIAFKVTHPVRSGAKDLACDGLAGDEHAPEVLFIEPEQSSRFGDTACGDPGYVQQQHGFAKAVSGFVDAQKDRLAIICARGANLAFEEQMEKTSSLTFGRQQRSDRGFDYFSRIEAAQLLVG